MAWWEVLMPVGRTAKFSKIKLETAYIREMSIQLSSNRSGGHSCTQHANCALPQLETSVALCCDTTAHFIVDCYCPQHKVHLCNHAVESTS